MKYVEAVKHSMERIADMPNSIFIGYNLKYGSKSYGTLADVNQDKIIEMPVAEQLMTGVATGMALEGYLPVLVFERHDFLLLASDQIINHLSKMRSMSNGQYNPRVVIRAIVGGTNPFHPGPQHVQNFRSIFAKYTDMPVFDCNTVAQVVEAYKRVGSWNGCMFISEYRDLYNTTD